MTDELRKAAQDVVDAFTAPSSGFTAPWMGRLNAAFDTLRAALAQPDDAKQRLLEIMRKNGLATGHGDTIDDALKELDWQLSELKGKSDGTL